MVSLFITTLAILFVLGIGLYFWQKSTPDNSERVLPPNADFNGLFGGDSSSNNQEQTQMEIAERQQEATSLIDRARNGDRAALSEAHKVGDTDLYDRVLNEFVQGVTSDPDLLSLMSFVSQNELPVNSGVAKAVIASWQKLPNRSGTIKALHFAALSNNADLFRETVEQALQLWREGKLTGISAIEMRALFEGEFWILSSHSRRSGAGFILKRTLANARRELEAAASEAQA
ncbi:MAG TPA: hypothetical protein DC054_07635 [Blastocatellia bacterium]|nr:hypothetical protein [Blastocatellia bacterium]